MTVDFYPLKMEVLSLRFPHIIENMFKKLDNKTLIKCRKLSNSWQDMIDNQKEVWIRRIQNNTNCSQTSLKNILRKKKVESLNALAIETYQFCTKNFPLHSVAKEGHLEAYLLMFENVQNKNPIDFQGITPLHYAAQNGHLEVCQLILENVQEKNPKSNDGWTPMHYAAHNGHTEVYQLILENVQDKNPENNFGESQDK